MTDTVPQWEREFLDFKEQVSLEGRPAPATREPILIWSVTSGAVHLLKRDLFWGLLARNHGYDATMVLCDGSLGACILNNVFGGGKPDRWERTCANCRVIGREIMEASGMPYVMLGDALEPADFDEAEAYAREFDPEKRLHEQLAGVKVGMYSMAALGRYGRCPYPLAVERHAGLIPRFVRSGHLSATASRRLLDRFDPALVVTGHKTYTEWGPIWDMLKAENRAVMICQPGIVAGSVVMKVVRDEYAFGSYALSGPEWEALLARGMDAGRVGELADYVSRYKAGQSQRENFFDGDEPELDDLRRELGLTEDKPVWCVYTHLVWDAQMSEDMVYPGIDTWLRETCRIIAEVTDVDWIIKIHPSEHLNQTESGARELVDEFFVDGLPGHIRVIPATSRVNSYHLHELVDGGVTVRGTVGMELTLMGKPVILCSVSHYGGKGFTCDCATEDEYREALRTAAACPRLTRAQRDMAMTYAHSFFVDRQIPMDFEALMRGRTAHADFVPGADPFNDRVLEAVMDAVRGGGSHCLTRTVLGTSDKPHS
ncbi:hypothetical protein [Pseudodesulfovibrio methanolicus]|uniref:Capsule polysaccharide biosynthesis protein n=1 Tax=Pseudodesulfovibrio methanolicus TaxID=3126690 RepID=A0ABZ2IX23_9BACT